MGGGNRIEQIADMVVARNLADPSAEVGEANCARWWRDYPMAEVSCSRRRLDGGPLIDIDALGDTVPERLVDVTPVLDGAGQHRF